MLVHFFLNPISFLVAFWQLVYIFELVPSAEWVIVQLVCAYHCVPLQMLLSEFVWEYKLNWLKEGTLWWAIDCCLWSMKSKLRHAAQKVGVPSTLVQLNSIFQNLFPVVYSFTDATVVKFLVKSFLNSVKLFPLSSSTCHLAVQSIGLVYSHPLSITI